MRNSQLLLGIHHSASDPSAALFRNGKLVSFIEEERLIRIKHADGHFPIRSIDYILRSNNLEITDIDRIIQAWDVEKYDSGVIQSHFNRINEQYPTSELDLNYQKNWLDYFKRDNQESIIHRHLRKKYGDITFPEIEFVNHHLAHACTAFFNSGFSESLVLSIDGSGEEVTTSWWLGKGEKLELLEEIKVPHSLGWFYSAFTEYLGFRAYNGEYKVMGLAAYGKSNDELRNKINQIIWYNGKGGFETNPTILSRGKRKYSRYFPDIFADHMGRPPRPQSEDLNEWHKSCAYEVQCKLEEIVMSMTEYWIKQTGVKNLSISGGVGLNVKMNGNLLKTGLIDDLFIYPLCSDTGSSIGACMAYLYNNEQLSNDRLEHVYWGVGFSDNKIQEILDSCGISYKVYDDIEDKAAELLAKGQIIGWFQGKMEGGPRALGGRSILADPRKTESRDKVNIAIKYREEWRPFCPSMTTEGANKYLENGIDAPFMIITFIATEEASSEVPAIVHVDQSTRPQIVNESFNPRYGKLLKRFEVKTGVSALLNTSFNIKGEPIVCTPQDALRTFFSTGLDALVIGNCVVEK